ncbi:unnamed protein product [Rotaria socialis]|uniref:Uncharacterized protein n=1 Tax=Rotaria socialis TaxID=392032 RepID=A0A818FYA7_9BILA|nr:unnamed protein product [Rotaria socialis]
MVVAYIPEGLPAAVTLVLSIVAKRMYKQKILVKSLATVETFNTVPIIATDKTGTLTMNQMTITAILWGRMGEYLVPIHVNEDKTVETEEHATNSSRPSFTVKSESNTMNGLVLGACLCNNATKQSSSSDNEDDSENPAMETNYEESSEHTTKLVGDAADVALYRLCQDTLAINIEHVRVVNPRINAVPFNSKNKFMLTANLLEKNEMNTNENVLITLKGAPRFYSISVFNV